MRSSLFVHFQAQAMHFNQWMYIGVFKPLKNIWQKVMLKFYREARMQAVEKGSFPTLLKKFWDTKSSLHLVSGFKGAGLWPFDQSAVNIEKCKMRS